MASVFRVERLLQEAPTLPADATCSSAYDLLLDRPELPGVVVLSGDRMVGYVDRNSLLTRFAQHLMRDFHMKRPVTLLVDRPVESGSPWSFRFWVIFRLPYPDSGSATFVQVAVMIKNA